MRPTTLRRLIAATAALTLSGSVAVHAATPAVPITSDSRDALVVPFTGAAVAARPVPPAHVPQNPFMAANGGSNIHNDGYQSDAYDVAGPLGRDLQVSSTSVGGECASVTFDRRGRIVTVCVSPTGATLRMIDPDDLSTLASYDLPRREVGSFSFSNFSGGGYFYLDHRDRAVVSTSTGHVLTLARAGDTFRVVRDVNLSRVVRGSGIQSALPDWSGRLWFVTVSGVVGFVTRGGKVRHLRLPRPETIANSFAMDESGGVFVVSTHALYRFDVRRGRPSVTWRRVYDRGSRIKPGQVSRGSGTTPTLIGRANSPGGGSIAITDNADPRMHVLVLRRGRAGPGNRPVCRQPVFPADRGNTENSLISVPGGLVVENNYGYTGPVPDASSGRSADTVPGMVKVAVDYRDGGCRVAWRNTQVRVPSLVSKFSRGSGLIYTYTHPAADEVPMTVATPGALAPDAFFLTAIDARTGREAWSRFTGSNLGYNNNYAPVSLGPDGTAYVGVVGGLLRVVDGS